MKSTLPFGLVLLMTAVAAVAQQNKNPVTSVAREILAHQQKNLISAVEEMPSEKFTYKPTSEQQTFAHLVVHMTSSNNSLCAKISDLPLPKQPQVSESEGKDKDKLLSALKASFSYCSAALERADDGKLGDMIEAYGERPAPRAWALFALTNDWADHYAAAAMYLRLNGLLPPTAQRK